MKTHRTWLKVIFNPFLRKIGFVIASKIDVDTDKFMGYQLRRFKNGKIGDKI